MATRPAREVNWCAENENPLGCFGAEDIVYQFNPKLVNWPMLLVMSGAFLNIHEARKAHYRGLVPEGWTTARIKNIEVCVWNPNPSWGLSP